MASPSPSPKPFGSRPALVHRLEVPYFLLWAYPSGESTPFEVSKEVTGSLQPACTTSPYCPDERRALIRGKRVPNGGPEGGPHIASVIEYERNPLFRGVSSCPYGFQTKEECYRDINIKAMTQALFNQDEVVTLTNFLKALDYQIEVEKIPSSEIDGTRILKMHGQIYNFHETRFEMGPGRMTLCMIRSTVDVSG